MNSRSSDSDESANSYHSRFRSALHYAALLANGTLRRQSNSFVLVSEEIKVEKIGKGLPQNKFLSRTDFPDRMDCREKLEINRAKLNDFPCISPGDVKFRE